jgi:hypothetical protein
VGSWNIEAGVLDGGVHPVADLAHGVVGKARGVEVIFVGLDAGEVYLDVDHVRVNAVVRSAEGFETHKVLGLKWLECTLASDRR